MCARASMRALSQCYRYHIVVIVCLIITIITINIIVSIITKTIFAGKLGARMEVCAHQTVDELLRTRWDSSPALQPHPHPQVLYACSRLAQEGPSTVCNNNEFVHCHMQWIVISSLAFHMNRFFLVIYTISFLKQEFRKYPSIHTNYIISHCTTLQ